jgi:hypothetical protein
MGNGISKDISQQATSTIPIEMKDIYFVEDYILVYLWPTFIMIRFMYPKNALFSCEYTIIKVIIKRIG